MHPYQVKSSQRVQLKKWDPKDDQLFQGDKNEAEKLIRALNQEIEAQQELLFAERKHKLLVLLQGMDTSGKDGVIRRVFDGVNPQGVKVASFKVPTPEELDHDYLWRVHKQTPGKGEITIFNRSHYEDVLVVRVHSLVPEPVWSQRFDQICDFERLLFEEGTIIRKFFLHISKDELKERLQARLDDPTKHWKFSLGDLKERALWDNYLEAYEDVLNKTSREFAPWYIIPADRKWYRDLVISQILLETLKDLDMHFPEPKEDLSQVEII
jgi:PPK2 family polyphosphate:nucleotide phosphotransferase